MAINKKEAAAHAKEIDELKLRLALCWTPEVHPDIPLDAVNFSQVDLALHNKA